jgi:hypothetical protein
MEQLFAQLDWEVLDARWELLALVHRASNRLQLIGKITS